MATKVENWLARDGSIHETEASAQRREAELKVADWVGASRVALT